MNFPEELKYTEDHEWVRIEDNMAYIGITDFAQGELGDIVFVEFDTEGEELEKGAIMGSIEAVKTVSEVYMPLDGKVIAINAQLEDEPELVNTAPYTDGWLAKIEIADLDGLDHLLDAAAYQEQIGV